MNADLVGAAGDRPGFDERRAVGKSVQHAKLGASGRALVVDRAAAELGRVVSDRRIAREMRLPADGLGCGRDRCFSTSPAANCGCSWPAKCRVRAKTTMPVVLASSRWMGRSFCGWYTSFRIDCSVLRLNRPDGCSGSGAGLSITTIASSSCSTRIAALTSGSDVAGMRCRYRSPARTRCSAVTGWRPISSSRFCAKRSCQYSGGELRKDAAQRVEQCLAVVLRRDVERPNVVVRLAAGQRSRGSRDGQLALGDRALASARLRSDNNSGQDSPST